MTRGRGRAPTAVAAAVFAIAILLLPGGQPAGARQTTTAALDFVAQVPWVGAGGQWGVRFKITRPTGPSDLEVVVGIYSAVAFRSEFQETLDNRIFGEPVVPEAVFPLGSLSAEPNGDYSVPVPAALGPRDGVHPVRVTLRDRDDLDVRDEFVTHLVYLPEEHTGPRLGVSIVLPVHQAPALLPDGTRTRPDDAELSGLSLAIDSARALPVSFAPTPETVTALVASNDPRAGTVLTSLREAVTTQSLISGPYVPVSLSGLTTAGLEDEIARQLTRGASTLAEALRASPSSDTWVAQEPLDAASLDLLANRGVTRVVSTEAGLTPIPDQLVTLTGPFQLDGERTSVQGAAADSGLAAHFDSQQNPALQAEHFLADLAVLYLDLPGASRGVIAVAPRTWRPDRVFLDTLRVGLNNNPVVEAISLATLFSTIPDATDLGEPLIRRPAVDAGGGRGGLVDGLRAVRRRLDSLGSVLGPTNAISDDLNERLLVSESADFRSARQRDPYLAGVQKAIDDQLGGIVMPQNRSITLTAREGEIPVTFQNHTGHPVKVIVRMQSDKLSFPAGETLEIDLTRLNTTHRFPVVARTSGAFPIRITLESPDGGLVVGQARLTVRSTATSGVGLAISVGAALFLALWWGRHALKGRRAKRLMDPSQVLETTVGVAGPTAGATVQAVPPVTNPPTAGANGHGAPDIESPPVPAPGSLGGG